MSPSLVRETPKRGAFVPETPLELSTVGRFGVLAEALEEQVLSRCVALQEHFLLVDIGHLAN